MSKKVILDHDGGVDDLVALALLCTRPGEIDVIGTVVLNADCFIEDAVEVSGKLEAGILQRTDKIKPFPVGASSLGGVHDFPKDWRKDAYNMKDLPCVNHPDTLALWEKHNKFAVNVTGEQLMADLVMKADSKVTICVTGPLTNVAWCVEKYGEAFWKNVDDVVIMGGAVDTKGNVFMDSTDGSAEWNIYWDAPAAATVLGCGGFRKVLFSLDSTNSVPVNSPFVAKFGAQNEYFLSQFCGNSWAMCTHFIRLYGDDLGYYAWDALTAAFVMDPSLVELDPIKIKVEVGNGDKCEGQTRRLKDGEVASDDAIVHVARNTVAEKFYDMTLAACRFV